jgi:hypothetical protein
MKLYTPNNHFITDIIWDKVMNPVNVFNLCLYGIASDKKMSYGQKVETIYRYLKNYCTETGLTTSEIIVRTFEDLKLEELEKLLL